MANVYDQFDTGANPYDQFDAVPAEVSAQAPQATLGGAFSNAYEAGKELIGGMIPRSFYQYATQIYPPLAAYEQGKQLAQGDVSSIPFVGRVPEIVQAEQTPAFSKERFLTAAKTLMDVGLLAGAGAAKPRAADVVAREVKPPPIPEYASTIRSTEEMGVRGEGADVGKGAPLRQPRETAPTQEPAAAPVAPNVPEQAQAPVEAPPKTAGTSHRELSEIYGEENVPSGTGVDTSQLLADARAAISSGRADPYSVLSKTRDRGIANPEEYAQLATEHERLVNEAVAKERAGDPTAAEAAKQAEDFANALQPHKTAASDLMRLFQGELNYDLSTTFGIDQYMKAEIGRGLKASERPAFERRARSIVQGETEMQQAVARSDARVRARYAKVPDITIEEAATRVREWLKDCQV